MDPPITCPLFKITPRKAAVPALPRGSAKAPKSLSDAKKLGCQDDLGLSTWLELPALCFSPHPVQKCT